MPVDVHHAQAEVPAPCAWRHIDRTADAAGFWPGVAQAVHAWLADVGVAARDAVVLVPFAALVEPARVALASRMEWPPRVETPLTLAESLGPPPDPAEPPPGIDRVLDRLHAEALLRRQAWARELDEPGTRARAAADMADAARELYAHAEACAPEARAAWWRQVREALPGAHGPAALEARLLALAVDWACEAATPPAPAATDRLFAHRPGAWVVLRIGGAQPLADALLGHGGTPSLCVVADPPDTAPWGGVARQGQLLCLQAADAEDEAWATASTVLQALADGQSPVALVTLDRELTRRVLALLRRQGVPLIDETGWKLATTPVAAYVRALLAAARAPQARDTLLQWLKAWPPADRHAVDQLEAAWRRGPGSAVPDEAAMLLEQAHQALSALRDEAPQPLALWLQRLAAALSDARQPEGPLHGSEGDQLVEALRLQPQPAGGAWHARASTTRLDAAEFQAWVEATLADADHLPPPVAQPRVVLTPLARVFARPVGHVVIPATDAANLGLPAEPARLIGDAWARRVGLPDAAARLVRQRLALAHALSAPRATLLRRLMANDEPLAESALVQALVWARREAGLAPWPTQRWQPRLQGHLRVAVPRPAPQAAGALPVRISATQLEQLRSCPYRFFAQAVLRLDVPEELEADVDKRDYGTWLHAVLHRFHVARAETGPAGFDTECERLRAAATAVTAAMDLDDAELLPFTASFERLLPLYLAWQGAREAEGWHWHAGETAHERTMDPALNLVLRGRIDRIDRGSGGELEVVDYKTGSAAGLAKRLARRTEDTQLPFYVALLDDTRATRALYLTLDGRDSAKPLPHKDVQATTALMLEQLAQEWARLQAGAALPALGEAPACDHCDVRGLCRRDHWGPA